MAVGDKTIADFTVNFYAVLKLKRPHRVICFVPETTDIDCFSHSVLFVNKSVMASLKGSGASLEGISPRTSYNMTAQIERKN